MAVNEQQAASLPAAREDVTQRVRLAAFLSILDGRAPSAEYLAGQVRISAAQAAEAVAALREGHRAVTGADGRVVGVGGLSLVETVHRLKVRGAGELWCWCAWDTVGISAALRLTADISTPGGGR